MNHEKGSTLTPRPFSITLISSPIASKSNTMFPLLLIVFITTFLTMFCFRHLSAMSPSCVFLVLPVPDLLVPVPYMH